MAISSYVTGAVFVQVNLIYVPASGSKNLVFSSREITLSILHILHFETANLLAEVSIVRSPMF